MVDHLQAAQKLKGCTIIEGALNMRVVGGSEYMNHTCHNVNVSVSQSSLTWLK